MNNQLSSALHSCPLPIQQLQKSYVVPGWALGSRLAAGVRATECPGKPWPQETNPSQVQGRAKVGNEADSPS